jgi:hypothetical protein
MGIAAVGGEFNAALRRKWGVVVDPRCLTGIRLLQICMTGTGP